MRVPALLSILLALACGGAAELPVVPTAPIVPVPPIAPPSLGVDASAFPAAPPIVSDHWLQGEAVDVLRHDKPILLEVWGTWCGPCLPAGFHVQRIAEAHPNDLTVIGLAQDTAQKAGPFLKQKGWTFRNATDPGNVISDSYGVSSVPHTFVLVGGRIVWHGHPNGVEPVLDEVLAGRWNAAAAKAYEAIPEELGRYFAAVGTPEASAVGARIVEGGRGRPYELNDLAWKILTEVPEGKRDLPLALKAAETALASTHGTDYAVLDTTALAMWQSGRKDDALKLQKDASRLCAADQGSDCAEIDQRLKQFGG